MSTSFSTPPQSPRSNECPWAPRKQPQVFGRDEFVGHLDGLLRGLEQNEAENFLEAHRQQVWFYNTVWSLFLNADVFGKFVLLPFLRFDHFEVCREDYVLAYQNIWENTCLRVIIRGYTEVEQGNLGFVYTVKFFQRLFPRQ